MATQLQFELSVPVKYHSGGEEVEGTFITLIAPSYKQMDKCVPLKQAFYRAASSITDEGGATVTETDASSDDSNLTSEGLISLFYQSDEDMVKIILYGVELFKCRGIAMVDGSVAMTQVIIEKMSQEDIENMLGSYMVNFILASALNKAGSK